MGFLRIFGGRDNGSDNTGSEGSVVNFELMTFMREAFGKDVVKLKHLVIKPYHIDFLLIDNDLLVTNGLSVYTMRGSASDCRYELAVRVPFKWKSISDSPKHTWITDLIKSIIDMALTAVKPIGSGYIHTFEKPFHYTTELNTVTLYNIAEKHLQTGINVNFMMVVPLYESELEDGYYKQESTDLKGLAWQRASLVRGNEFFDTLDNYYPYDDNDTQGLEDYFALRDEALPGWNPDVDAVGCRVSSGIVNSKVKIGYMYRAKPEDDFSGWYFLEVESGFMTDSDPLPLDYYADTDSDLFTVAFLFPEIRQYLKMMPGTAIELQETGNYALIQ